jgi:N4-gp56 family major capsid protein
MSNSVPSRLGQVNATGTAYDALFLKVFSGEVLASFAQENKMLGMSTVRTISSGKSAQFPVTGTIASSYHTVGNEILGTAVKHNEKIINIDDMLIAHAFIAEIDQLKASWEARSVYSKEMGQALGNKVDQHLLQLVVLASAAAANVTGGTGGDQKVVDADCKTNATSLIASVFEAIQQLDENNVPSSDRAIIVTPDVYYQLCNVDKLVSRDFSSANGDFGKGSVVNIGGVPVIKSNTAVTAFTDQSAAISGTNNTYNVDAQHVGAVVFHKSAVGTVKLKDMVMENTYDPRRIGNLLTSRLALGHGILRPESAVRIIAQ